MRLLVAGDTHQNYMHIVDTLFVAADREGIDRIFVVGDFGYWPRNKDGQTFLKELEKTAKAYGIVVYWLDGNHEDHHALRDLKDRREDSEGFWRISEHIRYAPRGHRWTWDGVRFLALGGAFSIDRNWRRVGVSFFFEEVLEQADVYNAIEGGKVDIMLTHDLPAGDMLYPIEMIKSRGYSIIPESYRNTMYVREVVDAVQPELLIHGHYHMKYGQPLDNDKTYVVGLCCDGSGKESYVIIDLDNYKTDK